MRDIRDMLFWPVLLFPLVLGTAVICWAISMAG